MKAYAVIGSWYGDCGKGLMTDYLAHKHDAVVVRFNGGAQAGHTVVTPDGQHHVFHHFGSGTLAGSPTYLSQFFIANPVLFRREWDELNAKGINPIFSIDPYALVTTPYDMALNQELEKARQDGKHGSVGLGIFETMSRHQNGLPLQVLDLRHKHSFRKQLIEIRERFLREYSELGLSEHPVIASNVIDRFMEDCEFMLDKASPKVMGRYGKRPVVFEGAQGLLLDPDYGTMPHCTPSSCGLRNVVSLIDLWERFLNVDDLEVVYVTRSYMTRHGAGPLPGEKDMGLTDDTNVDHEYQGPFRYAPLGVMPHMGFADFQRHARLNDKMRIAVTHLDQYDDGIWENYNPTYLSFGPTREDIDK